MKSILFLFFLGLLSSCTSESKSILEDYSSSDLESIFNSENVNGCFIIYDFKADKKLTYNSARLDSTFLPASTFKIINSMIALETRVIKDENEIIAWDEKKRFVKEWNQDHNLKSGIKYSVVWFYQELARRIGKEKMQYWVDAAQYGNQNIGGKIDYFWLNGDIRISPNQQIDFLQKLYLNELPFSKKNQEIVKDIMLVDETPDYTIHAKTGWAMRVSRQIGWYVGYLEKGENVYFFTINMDIENKDDAPKRKIIVSKILNHLQLTKSRQLNCHEEK